MEQGTLTAASISSSGNVNASSGTITGGTFTTSGEYTVNSGANTAVLTLSNNGGTATVQYQTNGNFYISTPGYAYAFVDGQAKSPAAAPVGDSDLTRKDYVDGAVAALQLQITTLQTQVSTLQGN